MDKLDIFRDTLSNRMVIYNVESKKYKTFTSNWKELILVLEKKIKQKYQQAYIACSPLPHKLKKDSLRFDTIERFLRCNFSEHNKRSNFDKNGELILEFVDCPIRGGICEEEGIICQQIRKHTKLKKLH